MSASTVPSVAVQREHVTVALNNLKTLGAMLPPALPLGTDTGPIARHFGHLDLDSDEGPYYALDRAWVRTFQVPDEEQKQLVCRGEFGIPLLHAALERVALHPAIEANNSLFLMGEKLQWLNRLIAAV